ncbi:MAG: hypothetical protein EOM64_09545, partial [Erysipelotrichia bacterium]|nr:hypothetical protein [Erysipelotrichia bacterium]
MKLSELGSRISTGDLDSTLMHLYGEHRLQTAKKRYLNVINKAEAAYGDREAMLFSARIISC